MPPGSLKSRVAKLTLACIGLACFCLALMTGLVKRVQVPPASTLGYHSDAKVNFSFISSWTPVYTIADRRAMPQQTVPSLASGFEPTCRMDAPCISFGSTWFGDFEGWWFVAKNGYPIGCEVRCHLVSDVSEADAVVFNGRDLPVTPPVWKRHPNQLWVYLNLESPISTEVLGLDVARYPAYHTVFNATATFQPESNARTVYGLIQARAFPVAPRLPDMRLKKRLAYIVASNCWHTFNNRPDIVRRLQSVMELDVYGNCGDLKLPRSDNAFRDLSQQYYFYLSFENAFCKDYITEKFFKNALMTDAAPVAIGGLSRSDYEAAAPPNSFVYGPDFNTANELADHLRKLAADRKAYLAMFAWRATYEIKEENLLCGTCRALYKLASSNATRTSAHLKTYYDTSKLCRPANVTYLF